MKVVTRIVKEFNCRCSHIFHIFSYLTALARLSLVTVNERPGNVSSITEDWFWISKGQR